MLQKLEKFMEAYGKLKWNVWFCFLVIIIPICFLLVAYDGIRLLLNVVPPKDYQRVIENVAIRSGGAGGADADLVLYDVSAGQREKKQ
jgi:hypothetical protein